MYLLHIYDVQLSASEKYLFKETIESPIFMSVSASELPFATAADNSDTSQDIIYLNPTGLHVHAFSFGDGTKKC